jgi:hypothetical protein
LVPTSPFGVVSNIEEVAHLIDVSVEEGVPLTLLFVALAAGVVVLPCVIAFFCMPESDGR